MEALVQSYFQPGELNPFPQRRKHGVCWQEALDALALRHPTYQGRRLCPRYQLDACDDGEYCGGLAQWQLMVEDIASTLKFEFPLSAFALNVGGGLMSPNINSECKCCLRTFLTKVIHTMHAGLQATQSGDTRTRGVAV